jgi:hypothetical protein
MRRAGIIIASALILLGMLYVASGAGMNIQDGTYTETGTVMTYGIIEDGDMLTVSAVLAGPQSPVGDRAVTWYCQVLTRTEQIIGPGE